MPALTCEQAGISSGLRRILRIAWLGNRPALPDQTARFFSRVIEQAPEEVERVVVGGVRIGIKP